jgi:hypothetical protein
LEKHIGDVFGLVLPEEMGDAIRDWFKYDRHSYVSTRRIDKQNVKLHGQGCFPNVNDYYVGAKIYEMFTRFQYLIGYRSSVRDYTYMHVGNIDFGHAALQK